MRQETNAGARLAAWFAAAVLGAAAAAAQSQDPKVLGFKKVFAVDITNPSPFPLENHALVLDVAAIRSSVAPDFNTYNYALFEEKGGAYTLVVSQADDLDKDRYHDEIVLVRGLPPSSTTRLLCYYSPAQSFRLMPVQKAFARAAWEPGGAEAGWESNLALFKFIHGRVGFYGKLQAGLMLQNFPAAESRPQDWGMDLLGAGESAGLGGLVLWAGGARAALFGAAAPKTEVTVLAPGPVRALVKAEYADTGVAAWFSAFAENVFCRTDVVIAPKAAGPLAYGPGLQKLAGETWSVEKDKGFLLAWGKGTAKTGEVGLAAIFQPEDFAGLDETPLERTVKLNGRPGVKATHWLYGAWERGITSPGVPASKNWVRRVEDLARRLLVPVKVEFKAR